MSGGWWLRFAQKCMSLVASFPSCFPSLRRCNAMVLFPGRHESVNGPAACYGKFLAVAFLLGTSPFLPGNFQRPTQLPLTSQL